MRAASSARLVSWEPRVRFRHPLIRSAAYYAAPAALRRRAHAALAAVTDPGGDPDRPGLRPAPDAAPPPERAAPAPEHSARRPPAPPRPAAPAAFPAPAAA